jgi:hypothetical protein
MRKFEVTIWEKAEHWTFEVTIEAKDEADARKRAAKEYPPRSYSIRSIR